MSRPSASARVEPAMAPDAAASNRASAVTLPNSLSARQAGGFRILAALDPLLDADGEVAADFVVEIVDRQAACATPCSPAPGS